MFPLNPIQSYSILFSSVKSHSLLLISIETPGISICRIPIKMPMVSAEPGRQGIKVLLSGELGHFEVRGSVIRPEKIAGLELSRGLTYIPI